MMYSQRKSALGLNSLQQRVCADFIERLNGEEYSLMDVPCVCGCVEGTLIAEVDRYGLPCETKVCHHCGSLWTSKQLDTRSLNHFYANVYRMLYDGDEKANGNFYSEQLDRGGRIISFLNSVAGRKGVAFDVGCGAGGMVEAYRAVGWEAYGCDHNDDFLAYGKERGLNLYLGGIEALAEFGPADLITFNHVLEHIPCVDDYIEDVLHYLRPGGLLYIELPGIYNIHCQYGQFVMYLQNAHLQHYHLELLQSMMARHRCYLEKGDHIIHAVFRYQPERDRDDVKISTGTYTKTLRYLELVEKRHKYLFMRDGIGRWVNRTRGMTRLTSLLTRIPCYKGLWCRLDSCFNRSHAIEAILSDLDVSLEQELRCDNQ